MGLTFRLFRGETAQTPLLHVIDNTKPAMTEAYTKVEPSPVRSIEAAASVKASWSPEVHSFMDWFMKLEPPETPFYLEPHRKVIDPEKFFVSLQNEIAIGPSCPRNRTGALLCDLKILRKILH